MDFLILPSLLLPLISSSSVLIFLLLFIILLSYFYCFAKWELSSHSRFATARCPYLHVMVLAPM